MCGDRGSRLRRQLVRSVWLLSRQKALRNRLIFKLGRSALLQGGSAQPQNRDHVRLE